MFRLVFFIGCIFLTALYSCQLVASPWVNTDDRYLRTSIKLLADAGYLNIPINTYPLMWQPILAELAQIDRSQLAESELLAFLRISSAVNHARAEQIKTLAISAASDSFSPAGFSSHYAERAKLSVSTEFKGNNWALGIQKNFNYDPFALPAVSDAGLKDYSQSHDWQGSYAAFTLGNWVFSASQQQQWWGPGYDSSFNFSNKGPAAKILRLNRLNSAMPITESLDFIGAVNLTLELGQQPGSAFLRHHNFTAARLSIKPWSALELSSSFSYHQALKDEMLQRLNLPNQADTESSALSQVDVRYSVSPKAAVYAAISHSNNDQGYLLGAEYSVATIKQQLSVSAELQWFGDDYPYWLTNKAAEAALVPTEQLLLAVQWYKGNGQAAYVHFKQQAFAKTAAVKHSSTIGLGYQQALFKGLISADYQLSRQQFAEHVTSANDSKYNQQLGISWQWRW